MQSSGLKSPEVVRAREGLSLTCMAGTGGFSEFGNRFRMDEVSLDAILVGQSEPDVRK